MIQDDGPGMTKEQMESAVALNLNSQSIRKDLPEETPVGQTGKGYGIRNINFRIKLCFGEKYGVHYQSKLGEGTTAIVRIPVMTIDEAEEKML